MANAWGQSWSAAWGDSWGNDGPVVEMARRLLRTSLDGLMLSANVPLDATYAPAVELDGVLIREEPQ